LQPSLEGGGEKHSLMRAFFSLFPSFGGVDPSGPHPSCDIPHKHCSLRRREVSDTNYWSFLPPSFPVSHVDKPPPTPGAGPFSLIVCDHHFHLWQSPASCAIFFFFPPISKRPGSGQPQIGTSPFKSARAVLTMDWRKRFLTSRPPSLMLRPWTLVDSPKTCLLSLRCC